MKKWMIYLLVSIVLGLIIWFVTTLTFCGWLANRNFQRRIKADGRYDAMNAKLEKLRASSLELIGEGKMYDIMEGIEIAGGEELEFSLCDKCPPTPNDGNLHFCPGHKLDPNE